MATESGTQEADENGSRIVLDLSSRMDKLESKEDAFEVASRKRQFVFTLVSLTIAVLSLATAGVSAWYGGLAAREAERATQSGVWSEFLTRFDGDRMWEARKDLRYFYGTVRRNHPRLTDKEIGDLITAEVRAALCTYVYPNQPTAPKFSSETALNDFPELKTDIEKRQFAERLDRSRRYVKNFFETVQTFIEQDLATREFIQDRWGNNTIVFLTEIWAPIEIGQNQAYYGATEEQAAKPARLCDWYERMLQD